MRGWHNAGLWREWNVLFCLDSFFPFHLDSFFSNWPSPLSSVLLCVVPASALSLSPRERFDVSPLCRRPPVPWLVDSRRGWRGDVGVDGGWKRAGQRGGTCTQSLACVSASSSTASLDRGLNSRVSDHHTVAVTSLAVSLSLSQFISFLSPSISSSFCPLPFVRLSIYVLWERELQMTGESFRLCRITHNLRQMEHRGTKEYGYIFSLSRSLSSCANSTKVVV